jgi:hypothetical protein
MTPLLPTVMIALGAATMSSPTDDGVVGRSIAVLERLDATTTSVDFDREPLETVIEMLDGAGPAPVAADWTALETLFVGPDDEITLHLEDVAFSTVLAAVTLELGDDLERPLFEVHGGRVMLTTLDATAAMGVTDVYDVRDLVADERTFERLRAERTPVDAPEPPPGEVEADEDAPTLPEVDVPTTASGPVSPTFALMELLTEHIDPEAWTTYGGNRATMSDRNGAVLVTAPPSIHRRLRDALTRLRRATSSAVNVDATIVDLPRAAFERLARRHDRGSAVLGRAVVGAADAVVLWQSTAGATAGRELSIESEAEGVGVELRLNPRLDPRTGILTVDLEAQTQAGADRRAVSTTVTIPGRRGAAVVELPAARSGATARFLVLLPRRS